MKKPSPKTVFMQNIWPLEPPWLPATLENQHQGGSCTTRGLYGSVCFHTKFEVYQKTKLSLFQFWLLFHLILLMLVSHQAYFSLCPPLKSLNFLDLSTSFYLRLPRRFAYCSIPWREQPLESLDWVTATLLFQGPPCNSEMSHSVQVLLSTWWEKLTFASESWSTADVSCAYFSMVTPKNSSPVLPRQSFWWQQN